MNIDINKSVRLEENNVERTSQTFNYAHKEDEELQNMIEKTTSCVVGISKIKNTGSTIFLNDGVGDVRARKRSYSNRKRIYSFK